MGCTTARRMMFVSVTIVLLTGCGSSDNSSTQLDPDNFNISENIQDRTDELKRLLPEATYDILTKDSRTNVFCVEDNRKTLGLPDMINGQWYYTYDNLIRGMAQFEEFANEGDDNLKKLEIAAFLANISQETGAGDTFAFGGPGCYIQEGHGSYWGSTAYNEDCTATSSCAAAGYCGRGPHQLSYDYNYKAFGISMNVGNKYLNDPDLLTKDPKTGISGSIWFWGHTTRTKWSPPDIPLKPSAHNVLVGKWTPTTSETPGVIYHNDIECGRPKANFGIIINIINGGQECGPGAINPQGAKNRIKYLEDIAVEMGIEIPDGFIDDCSTQKPFSPCTSY